MKNSLWLVLFSAIIVLGCEQKTEEDKVKEVDKDGSVEMKVEINHLDSIQDVMKTEKVYWVKGQAIKTIVDLDTVPALGMTNEVTQNASGEDTTVTIKKNYKIFITVK